MGTFSIRQLDLFYGEFQALKDISIDLPEKTNNSSHWAVWMWEINLFKNPQSDE